MSWTIFNQNFYNDKYSKYVKLIFTKKKDIDLL